MGSKASSGDAAEAPVHTRLAPAKLKKSTQHPNSVSGNYMLEVMAEDDCLLDRREYWYISSNKDNCQDDVEARTKEKLRFLCEDKWKAVLRCMDGHNLVRPVECEELALKAKACQQNYDPAEVKSLMRKKHVMGYLSAESRTRLALKTMDWNLEILKTPAPATGDAPDA
eukprot:TRINITY_DN43762_c0_g1_i1.p2 TRINITY_DN43762_c0_g1~~TRINITY_DN43762_c0_g1_i1.p2  ORF type:complete len:185 (+),score=65.60 TRINITY_DN43762_c0_g1_i1:50-556(+)